MCRGEFMDKTENEAWVFLENYAEKDEQWRSFHGSFHTNPKVVYSIDPPSFGDEKFEVEKGFSPVYHQDQEQANVSPQTNANSSQYHPKWRNHPNTSWSNPNRVAAPSHPHSMSQKFRSPHTPNRQTVPQNKSLSSQPYTPPHLSDSSQPSKDIIRLENQFAEIKDQTEQIQTNSNEMSLGI